MKALQYLAAVCLVILGVFLLCEPSGAQPPKSASAAFNPTRFTVTDAGTPGKPDILLIPGLSSSRSVWDTEVPRLAPDYRLHLIQIGGFAGAPAGPNASGPILPAVVDELHAYISARNMHPVVVGHSLGGLLTLMLAARYPADAAKLVIVDSLPFYGLVFDPNATVESLAPQARAIGDQMLAMPADQFAAMQPMMVKQMVKNEAGAKLVAASSIASDRTVFVHAMTEDLQTDVRSDLPKIKAPALLLYPFDASIPGIQPDKFDALYKGAYAAMPNIRVVRIDDSRHFIMYDQPEKFDAALQAFLK